VKCLKEAVMAHRLHSIPCFAMLGLTSYLVLSYFSLTAEPKLYSLTPEVVIRVFLRFRAYERKAKKSAGARRKTNAKIAKVPSTKE
jgi:hypothetical protein